MSAPVTPRRRTSPLAWLLIQPIRFYQRFITPYTPATCRYYPTCSAYAVGALRTHGAIKGTLLTAWRLLRCNPWSSGGVDKVPARGSWRRPPVQPRAADAGSDAVSDAATAVTAAEPTAVAGRSVTDPSEHAQPPAARAELAGRTAA